MLDHSIVDRSPHRPHHRTRGTHRYRVPLAGQTPGDGNTTSKGDQPAYCDSFYPPTKSGLPLHDGDVCSETFSVHCYSTNWGHRHPYISYTSRSSSTSFHQFYPSTGHSCRSNNDGIHGFHETTASPTHHTTHGQQQAY
jgi:hypothetical protein